MNNAEQISQNLENLSIVELRELQDKAGDLIKDKIEAEAQENIENIITVIKKNQIPMFLGVQ